MQERDHTFTAAFHPGVRDPSLHGPYGDLKRATDVADLLAMFAGRMYRELNITFIIDDNPAVMLPYSQRERMVELGQQGDCAFFISLLTLISERELIKFCRNRQITVLPNSPNPTTAVSRTLRKPAHPTRHSVDQNEESSSPTIPAKHRDRSSGLTQRPPMSVNIRNSATFTVTRWVKEYL